MINDIHSGHFESNQDEARKNAFYFFKYRYTFY